MRIISQNGEHDVPYEHCTFWTKWAENIIYATPIGEMYTLFQMAKYSTQEKAEKAMQMLHEAYTGAPFIMKNVEVPVGFAEQLKNMRSGSITVMDHGDNVKIEPMNIVFRFPKEDEL